MSCRRESCHQLAATTESAADRRSAASEAVSLRLPGKPAADSAAVSAWCKPLLAPLSETRSARVTVEKGQKAMGCHQQPRQTCRR